MAVLDPRSVGRSTSACLIEVDYLSNPRSEQRLRDPSQRAAIGAAIASAIQEHLATQPTTTGAQPSTNRLVTSPSTTAPSTHHHAPPRRKRHPGYAQAAAVVEPEIDYSITSLEDANRIWQDWLSRYAEWLKGVPDSVIRTFPHSAICQLRLYDASGSEFWGTGFYIGDEKILSCGHNFYDVEADGT